VADLGFSFRLGRPNSRAFQHWNCRYARVEYGTLPLVAKIKELRLHQEARVSEPNSVP
jgi:hypothetical protein